MKTLQYLYQKLNIPDSCIVGNTIFKKHFYDNTDMSSSDKKLFTKQIEKIIWKYSLKPESINIKPYIDEIREYNEIEVVEVIINSDKKIKRISEIVMRTIPYPMLLVFVLENKIQLWVAHQRTSFNDKSKNTIEEFIFTEWIDFDNLKGRDISLLDSIDISKVRLDDFYEFYSEIMDKLVVYKATAYTGKICESKDSEKIKEILDKIKYVDKQIDDLTRKLNKEIQFNAKVELNVKLKKLQIEKKDLVERLETN